MTLKAILFDFNGVIINDEAIHQELIDELLLKENLRPSGAEYGEICLGRSDRACIQDILHRRGRVISEEYLNKLIQQKAQAYQNKLAELDNLPIYPEIKDFIPKIHAEGFLLAIVSGALSSEIAAVLQRVELTDYFSAIVSGDEIKTSKPQPDGYLLAVEKLQEKHPQKQIRPGNCLAIEDTFPGIQAAKSAGIQVVGIANTYPLHMLQRQANWAVDYLAELEIERIQGVLAQLKV